MIILDFNSVNKKKSASQKRAISALFGAVPLWMLRIQNYCIISQKFEIYEIVRYYYFTYYGVKFDNSYKSFSFLALI